MAKSRFTQKHERQAYKMREGGETWQAVAEKIGCSASHARKLVYAEENRRERKEREKARGDGRPTTYTPEMAARICELIAKGKTTRQISTMEGMPHEDTIYDWKRDYAEFSEQIARARVEQTHAWAEQIITIADDIQQDVLRDGDGNPILDGQGNVKYIKEQPQRTKLRIETRQWIMERVNRGDFGQRQQLDVRHEFADKDDAEILHELRTAAEAAGLEPQDLTALLSGAGMVQ